MDLELKVFLILLDNLRLHHSKVVKKWLDEHQQWIEVFYLPLYASEHNPDEYLNGDLKQRIRSGLPSRNQEDLAKKTRSFMNDTATTAKSCQKLLQTMPIRLAQVRLVPQD